MILTISFRPLSIRIEPSDASPPSFYSGPHSRSTAAPIPPGPVSATGLRTLGMPSFSPSRPITPIGVYALNRPVVWTVDVKSGDRSGLAALAYAVKRDGGDAIANGTIDLSSGPATITSTRAGAGSPPGRDLRSHGHAEKNAPSFYRRRHFRPGQDRSRLHPLPPTSTPSGRRNSSTSTPSRRIRSWKRALSTM